MVAAMKDPNNANLDRIQIVKGWSKNGQSYEKIYDVALADGRKVDPQTGKAPPVGNTVNVSKATYENSIGDAQLSAFWQRPRLRPAKPEPSTMPESWRFPPPAGAPTMPCD
jgi:hypothetical protein